MENGLIHRMQVNGDMAVLDINSGAVHLIDQAVYDVLDTFDGYNDEETVAAWKDTYNEEELREILGELHQLKDQGLLFSPEFKVPDSFSEEPVLKSLCLHVAHDCNLRCKYCFAGTGDFGGKRELMSAETGKKAIDFAIAGSRRRHNLEIDLFGGEPLMNFGVVKEIITYARKREKEADKNIKLTLTTNGTLLNDESIKFLNDNRVMVVLSLDGGRQMHDEMRPFPDRTGSYDAAVRGFKKLIDSRKGWNYYLRGTYTHFSTRFADEVLKMAEIGKEISMEPVVGTTEPYTLTEDDLPVLLEEYDKLAAEYLKRRRGKGEPFDFFHFNVALDNGPCVAKRLAGCGAGHEYYAVTPSGEIYPCHQFVGREEYKMGTLETGVVRPDLVRRFRNTHVMTKPACKACWARFFCSGGCHANADLVNGDIAQPYDYGCKIQRKRLECAIVLQALLTEDKNEGAEDMRPEIDNFKYQVGKTQMKRK